MFSIKRVHRFCFQAGQNGSHKQEMEKKIFFFFKSPITTHKNNYYFLLSESRQRTFSGRRSHSSSAEDRAGSIPKQRVRTQHVCMPARAFSTRMTGRSQRKMSVGSEEREREKKGSGRSPGWGETKTSEEPEATDVWGGEEEMGGESKLKNPDRLFRPSRRKSSSTPRLRILRSHCCVCTPLLFADPTPSVTLDQWKRSRAEKSSGVS